MSHMGFENHETWATRLWLTNHQDAYRDAVKIACTPGPISDAADALAAMVQAQMPDLPDFYGWMLARALKEIHWDAIIDSIREDELLKILAEQREDHI